jgi:hypothetical protein
LVPFVLNRRREEGACHAACCAACCLTPLLAIKWSSEERKEEGSSSCSYPDCCEGGELERERIEKSYPVVFFFFYSYSSLRSRELLYPE